MIIDSKLFLSTLSIISVLFFCTSVASGQAIEQKLKLAESYEQGGDISSALRLYEEIYNSNKQEQYFRPIVRIYRQMNKWEELKPYVDERLSKNITANLLIIAGELY